MENNAEVLRRLEAVLQSRKPENGGDPSSSYTAKLFAKGPDGFLKKIGEEAAEVILAGKDAAAGKAPEHLIYETADLWFHCLVTLTYFNFSADDVLRELARREGVSGLVEKAQRPKE